MYPLLKRRGWGWLMKLGITALISNTIKNFLQHCLSTTPNPSFLRRGNALQPRRTNIFAIIKCTPSLERRGLGVVDEVRQNSTI